MKSHWASQSALEHPGCPLLYAEGVNSLPASPFRQHGAAVGSKPLPSRKASLRGADTCESINELGSLELMSRDLGLASYGPLKKSVSADSLNSVSSIGNNFGQDFTVGQVEVSMEYDGKAAALHVTLLQGKDLLEKEHKVQETKSPSVVALLLGCFPSLHAKKFCRIR